MAILTSEQLTELRNDCERDQPVRYVKAQANAAFQAIENVFISAAMQNALSNAIDTATAPLVLTPAEKRIFVKHWLRQRAQRGN